MRSKPSGEAQRLGDPAGEQWDRPTCGDPTEEKEGSWSLEEVPQPDSRDQEGDRTDSSVLSKARIMKWVQEEN